MFDVCAVGHVTRDVIRIQGRPPREQPGGPPYYAAMALASLGLRTAVVTRLAEADAGALLAGLRAAGVTVRYRPGAKTSVWENIYPEGGAGRREQRARAVAAVFPPADLDGVSARAWLLDPLTRRNGFASFLRAVARKGGLVALETQGVVRKYLGPGVCAHDRDRALAAFAHTDIVKAEAGEAAALTGAGDPAEAARRLAGLGAGEVLVTMGGRGSLVLAEGRVHRIPAYAPGRVVDATGCGDSYLAGYVMGRLESAHPEACGHFGAALAALKMERFGPFAGTRDEVEARLARGPGAGG